MSRFSADLLFVFTFPRAAAQFSPALVLPGMDLGRFLPALGSLTCWANQAISVNLAVDDGLARHLPDIQQKRREKATPAYTKATCTFVCLLTSKAFILDMLGPPGKTTIRLTEADRKILNELIEITGLKQSQVIRTALRVLHRSIPPVKKD
jgi:hypothetical protein